MRVCHVKATALLLVMWVQIDLSDTTALLGDEVMAAA